MSRQNLTAVIALAVFPLVAVGVAAYLVATNVPEPAALAGGLLVLAAGLFALAAVMVLRLSHHEDLLRRQQHRLQGLSDRLDAHTLRLEEMDERSRKPQLQLDEIMADVRVLRDGMKSLIAQKDRQPEAREPARESAPAAAPAKPSAANEHLELLLEPVIELASGTTTHYRALLNLSGAQGQGVAHGELMQKADAGGMRPALDAHLVKLVAPVLRRLRLKNPGMRAFVPIGAATLASREDTARIVASLERDADIAGGIVFEFEHRTLGQLSAAGIENLARLGRLGATMALSDVRIAGLDLASLRQLGVRFLSFPPAAADQGFGPSPAWREFVQYARAMQFQVIVSDIATPQQANAANQIGRYGYGPFFAPPRKVRSDAGAALADRKASAA